MKQPEKKMAENDSPEQTDTIQNADTENQQMIEEVTANETAVGVKPLAVSEEIASDAKLETDGIVPNPMTDAPASDDKNSNKKQNNKNKKMKDKDKKDKEKDKKAKAIKKEKEKEKAKKKKAKEKEKAKKKKAAEKAKAKKKARAKKKKK